MSMIETNEVIPGLSYEVQTVRVNLAHVLYAIPVKNEKLNKMNVKTQLFFANGEKMLITSHIGDIHF